MKARDYIKTAQDYINKLRSGYYAEAIGLVQFTIEKYKPFLSEINGDSLLPLLIHELSHTNFTESDLLHLNNIYLLIQANQLAATQADYFFTSLASASCALLILKKENEINDIKMAKLNSASRLETFLANQVESVYKITHCEQQDTIFSSKRTENEINAHIQPIYSAIQTSILRLKRCEELKSVVTVYIQFLEELATKLLMEAGKNNRAVVPDRNNLKLLLGDLCKHSVYGNQATKLYNRLVALNTFSLNLLQGVTLTPKLRTLARETITTCKLNEPTWQERQFLDKLTDILSFGLKPFFRYFLGRKNEREFSTTIEQYSSEDTSFLKSKL